MTGNPDLIARIKYLTTEEGGRKTPVYSGYFPQVKFEGKEYETGGKQIFIGAEWVNLGETIEVEIELLKKDLFEKYLYVGQNIEIKEGERVTGIGTILKIFNKYLER